MTFPKSIRQSAFTQKLDIEGCDPLSLPLAALLYQQANNFWLRKLAHGRELYIVPTGDIAAVVFMTELLTQLKAKSIDLDKVSHTRARQDGKMMDKTNNTKYACRTANRGHHPQLGPNAHGRSRNPARINPATQPTCVVASQKVGESPGR